MDILSKIEPIPGWLAPPAGMLTIYLAAVQRRLGIGGAMLEIGVHKGKFFSLMRSLSKEKLVGVQICDPDGAGKLAAEITSAVVNVNGFAEPVDFIFSDSLRLTPNDLLDRLGDGLRLVHIDGCHLATHVFHDMTIAGNILKDGGLMILDDAYNHSIPDVTEGIMRYFQQPSCSLKPFANCYNKMFVTTPAYHEAYLAAAKEWLLNEAPVDVRNRTLGRVEDNAAADYVPRLFGSEVAFFL